MSIALCNDGLGELSASDPQVDSVSSAVGPGLEILALASDSLSQASHGSRWSHF